MSNQKAKKIFAANWKLNKSPVEAQEFCEKLTNSILNEDTDFYDQAQLILFPSAFSIDRVANSLKNSQIEFGAQNCYFEKSGAFTGENSVEVLKSLGGEWVLIGHSERRQYFLETDELLNKKVIHTQKLGLRPMLCVGETLFERESGQTFKVLENQMQKALIGCEDKENLVIAYEPVWAIGTGKVATVSQIKETHEFIYKQLQGLGFSNKLAILYGGSVKPDNAKEILNIPHVDGCLIGGASLEVESYLKIIKSL